MEARWKRSRQIGSDPGSRIIGYYDPDPRSDPIPPNGAGPEGLLTGINRASVRNHTSNTTEINRQGLLTEERYVSGLISRSMGSITHRLGTSPRMFLIKLLGHLGKLKRVKKGSVYNYHSNL